MFEVEIKIKLDKYERSKIESFLESKKFVGTFIQEDHYFDTKIPSYAKLDKALRVRIEKGLKKNYKEKKIELTYKGPKLNSQSKTRKEINLNLMDNINFDSIESFLNELGFNNKYKISKERRLWIVDDMIHFAIDKNILGFFLEIEQVIINESQISEIEDILWQKVKTILGEIDNNRKITKSYLELILESDGTI